MQKDFHYYAAYCAAVIAGYSHEDAMDICYSDQFTDDCSRTLLKAVGGPSSAATTQLQLELMDARLGITGLQDITRIWSSFHFLPRDLYAVTPRASKAYKNRYRLICGPNSELLEETVNLAQGKSLQAAGIAMHILSDTWAHAYFAGTPSMVINNTDYYFYEKMENGTERQIVFRHSASSPDDVDQGKYTNSLYQASEYTIMNLGHGRAGHFPDYSYARYRYLPAWGQYEEIVKDNPSDYYHAFCQMVYALKCLKDGVRFEKDVYAFEDVEPYKEEIETILRTRKRNTCDEWKAFAKKLSGVEIEDYDDKKYRDEYKDAQDGAKDSTFLGKYFVSAMAQKSMVTNKIFSSGNLLAGFSVDYSKSGFKGIRDFRSLVSYIEREVKK